MGTKMKPTVAKKANISEDYSHVEKNIYKTGNRYRVRVGNMSEYTYTLANARKAKKRFKNYFGGTTII